MFATYSGLLVDPVDVKTGDINLIDIAHHLTNISRYGGALPFDLHYSVAEHSILLTNYFIDQGTMDAKSLATAALLHDASEAYLGDVVSGLKPTLVEYKKIEAKLQQQIYEKYGVFTNKEIDEIVSFADKSIVLNEVMVLTPAKYQLFKRKKRNIDLIPLKMGACVINDADYGCFKPGTVPKQVVNDLFLEMCVLLGVKDA